MKSNLHLAFKTNTDLEKNGVWFDLGDCRFLLKRFGGANRDLSKVMAKVFKPVAHLVEKDLLPDEVDSKLTAKAFVEACLVDWEGVEIDGEEVPFSKEKAIELMVELPDLMQTLLECSKNVENYRETLGN